VIIDCINGQKYCGELKGIINFGGIPAIWIESNINGELFGHVLLINNVIALNMKKDNAPKIIDGGLFA
jgi:hypothetical protein